MSYDRWLVLNNVVSAIRCSAVRVRRIIIAIGAILGALATPLRAEQCITLEDFSSSTLNSFPSGWTPREEAGRKVYVVATDGNMLFVRARATGARSAGNGVEADRPVKWNIEEYPILRWQWRARAFPRGANEHTGQGDSPLG